jgi:hypothetical protein
MSLDDLLNTPLPTLRDDGFSARIVLSLERRRQRHMTLLWCIIAAAILPVLWFLPLEQLGAQLSGSLNLAMTSPLFAPVAASLVLLWAWQTRVLRF